MSLLDRFDKKQIPPPFDHNGDIGLSDEFFDKTWILVAFCGTTLSAYRVKIHADGDLEPISYRKLKESCYQEGWDDLITYPLADIGGGKFFVVTDSYNVGLLMYVFQIDFTLEHHIQSFASGVGASSKILYYKKFQRGYAIDCFCIASAPPTIEDQDRVENTSKRERSGDETMYKSKILRSL
ncbi:PREDICTED: uncharacterized protein LOC109192382 [Ipomoea nil]|uniref:uncharacterized protein LOC109192382 n=1 Tax=Ipomoea nil TaxID=35883 RepID=UPI0009013034|nr:PREDICTED: uncharacterized protein LOC109192382 [Ipomoea nil]